MGEVTVNGAWRHRISQSRSDKRYPQTGSRRRPIHAHVQRRAAASSTIFTLIGSRANVYFLIVNASRIESRRRLAAGAPRASARREFVRMTDASNNYAAVAVQGPRVKEFIDACVAGHLNCAQRVGEVSEFEERTRSAVFLSAAATCLGVADRLHRRRWF